MKVLFIGLGGIGQRHLRNLLSVDSDIEVYAIRKRRENIVLTDKLEVSTGENLEEKYNITLVESIEEAVEKGVECAFICNPTSMHMEYLMSAIKNNMHIFIEKPLADSLQDVSELEQILKSYPNTTMIGYQNRFHPCIKRAKEIIEKQELGTICFVNAEIGENVTTWHKFEDYRRMYACRKELGGGVILSQIHELDYLYYFFGMPVSVYTVGGKQSDLEIDVEDTADILMQFNYNNASFPVHLHEDYLQIPPTRRCKICGTNGYLEFDLLSSKLKVYDKEGNIRVDDTYDFVRNDMFIEEITDYITAVKQSKASILPIEEGIQSLRMAIAAKESLEKKRVIIL